jgi:SAM-dependent methyltransferase
MLDFSRRNALTELMDSDETDFETFRACLIDLAKVNQLTLAYRPTLEFLDRLRRSGGLPRERAITIVDVGSGSGDMLRKIDQWAARYGYYEVDLVGVDLNPWSARTAEEFTAQGRPIRFVTANIFAWSAEPADIVVSSLFTHHLKDAAVVGFLAWMEANARLGWFVNDLRRHPISYHLFRLLARALRFHAFVQHDGPVSIARAFDAADWRGFLAQAEVPGAKIRRRFPYRLCVARFKSR